MSEILQVLFIYFQLITTCKQLASMSCLVIRFIFFNSQKTSSGDLLPSMSQLSPMEEFFCHASVGETVSNLFLLGNYNNYDRSEKYFF